MAGAGTFFFPRTHRQQRPFSCFVTTQICLGGWESGGQKTLARQQVIIKAGEAATVCLEYSGSLWASDEWHFYLGS